jgi:hypothetical protein
MTLSTSLYGSAGRGGGTGPRGKNYYNDETDILPYQKDLTEHYTDDGKGLRNADGFIDFDGIINYYNDNASLYSGTLPYTGKLIASNGYEDDPEESDFELRHLLSRLMRVMM